MWWWIVVLVWIFISIYDGWVIELKWIFNDYFCVWIKEFEINYEYVNVCVVK